MDEHYEIWGGWNDDAAQNVEAEFLETCGSLAQVLQALSEYRKGNRYAYARDMNDNLKVLDM